MRSGGRPRGRPSSRSHAITPPPHKMTSLITRTAKSAKGKTALTLLGVLAALSVGVFAYANAAKPDFSISVSQVKRSVEAGNTTSYTVKLKRLRKFKGAVTLGVSGLPSGAK